jgi:hypothetical protein
MITFIKLVRFSKVNRDAKTSRISFVIAWTIYMSFKQNYSYEQR